MGKRGFETLDVYRLSEDLADAIWDLVIQWQPFARDTVGKQLVRAADSIGANIAEGTGGTNKDNKNVARIGRGSLNETRHFLRCAFPKAVADAGADRPTQAAHEGTGPATERVHQVDRPRT